MSRFLLLLAALVLSANVIAGSCYVRKACLAIINDPNLCRYRV